MVIQPYIYNVNVSLLSRENNNKVFPGIIDFLKTLKDQVYKSEKEFIDALKRLIGEEKTEK